MSIFLDELIYLGLSKETLLAGVYFDSTSLCRSHFGPGFRNEPRDKISAAIYILPGWALALPRPKFYSPGPSCSKLGTVSARFELRFESLKSISVLILFVYKLMLGSSKNSRENYPRKCF